MKKTLILLVLAITFAFTSCKKDEPAKAVVIPTSMEFSVKDNVGNPVAGATVKLYATEADFYASTNQVSTMQITDAAGKATFTNLKVSKYWFECEKGCTNNANTGFYNTTALVANATNTFTVILSSTGSYLISNTSNDSYSVYVDNNLVGVIEGKQNEPLNYVPTGNHTVKVVQKTGIVGFAREETFETTINCGAICPVNFPNFK